jgi:hypothetical protein
MWNWIQAICLIVLRVVAEPFRLFWKAVLR